MVHELLKKFCLLIYASQFTTVTSCGKEGKRITKKIISHKLKNSLDEIKQFFIISGMLPFGKIYIKNRGHYTSFKSFFIQKLIKILLKLFVLSITVLLFSGCQLKFKTKHITWNLLSIVFCIIHRYVIAICYSYHSPGRYKK